MCGLLAAGTLAVYEGTERHRLVVAALDYGIEEAKRIKDWEALEEAVADKIEGPRRPA